MYSFYYVATGLKKMLTLCFHSVLRGGGRDLDV